MKFITKGLPSTGDTVTLNNIAQTKLFFNHWCYVNSQHRSENGLNGNSEYVNTKLYCSMLAYRWNSYNIRDQHLKDVDLSSLIFDLWSLVFLQYRATGWQPCIIFKLLPFWQISSFRTFANVSNTGPLVWLFMFYLYTRQTTFSSIEVKLQKESVTAMLPFTLSRNTGLSEQTFV